VLGDNYPYRPAKIIVAGHLSDVPMKRILDFRRDSSDGIIAFRSMLENKLRDIASIQDDIRRDKLVKAAQADLERGISHYHEDLRSSRIPIGIGALSLSVPAVINAANAASAHFLPSAIALGALGISLAPLVSGFGVLVSAGLIGADAYYKSRRLKRSNPYQYLLGVREL
jgi:hypothetical protein